jgi:cyclophilin family peptidyl-prolyl cis-trans isomerase/HEAT repeat protein
MTHAIIRLSMHKARVLCLCLALLVVGCATIPPQPPSQPPAVTWEDKLAWMMRLEDQRITRDPNPPPPAVLVPATRTAPAILAPPAPSDLIRLLGDTEGRVRRRAALALGRVGLVEGVDPLLKLLADQEPDVRGMAAFALGLIGDRAARTGLLAALRDSNPLVQGRAAEALGALGDRADADAVSGMVRGHLASGALNGVDPDDLSYPLAPPAEAVRLGLYALVRLGSFDALWAAAFGTNGQPMSRWWPLAYAVQRLNDPRGVDALIVLLDTPGRYTAAFAARGLGAMKAEKASARLREIVERRTAPPALQVQALRALATLGDSGVAPLLTKMLAETGLDPTVRREAIATLAQLATLDHLDLMLDLLADADPIARGAARRALARIDSDAFLSALSGLDADPDWTVRAAEAEAVASLPSDRAQPRLVVLLRDTDPRVVAAALGAMASAKVPGAEATLVGYLKVESVLLRARAASALADLKATTAVPALTEAYRAAQAEETYVARGAILAAVARLDPAGAKPLLDEALRDRDWAIRVRAEALLREANAGSAVVAARPAVGGVEIGEDALSQLVNPPFSPHAYIETDRGMIELELAILDAPRTVFSFMSLARRKFFDGMPIHRVVPDFVVQAGDPRGDGEGGPGYAIRDEINTRPYLRGTVGMALDWEDTGGSQFFITHSPQPHLDGRYTVFGQVVAGMETVDQLLPWDVIRRVWVWDGVAAD